MMTAPRFFPAVSWILMATTFLVGGVLFLLGAPLLLAMGIGALIWWAGLWAVALLFGLALLVGFIGLVIGLIEKDREALPSAVTSVAVNALGLGISLWAAAALSNTIFH